MKEHCISPRRGLTAATLCAFVGLLGVPSVLLAAESPGNDEVFTLKKTVAITGLAAFDISWVDTTLKQYLLADRTNATIDVIGTTDLTLDHQYTDHFAGATGNNDTSGPNGVLTLKNTEGTEIWVGDGPTVLASATPPATCAMHTPFPTTQGGNTFVTLGGKCSSVKVLSATGTALKTIPTNGALRADELCFDPTDNLILVANDADTPPFISFISTKTFTVVKQVPFYQATGGIEQCQWSPKTGQFYLNLPVVGNGPDGNVLVISPKTMTVVNTFDIPVANCAAPQGMAIGPDNQILLGCNGKTSPGGSFNSVVINQNSGAIVATLVNLGGADEVWFDEIDDHWLISGGSHKASASDACNKQFGIVDTEGNKIDQITCLTSAANPHSIAGDNASGNVFVPVSGGVQVYTPSQPDDHPRFVLGRPTE